MVKKILTIDDCIKIGKVLNPKTNRCNNAKPVPKAKSAAKSAAKSVAKPKPVKKTAKVILSPVKRVRIITYFNNKTVVFTGFRSKELENVIESNNGKVMGNISKKTDLLVIKDNNEMGEKFKKARLMNIKIITKGALEAIIKYGYKSSSRSSSNYSSSSLSRSSSNSNRLDTYMPTQMVNFFYNKKVVFVGFENKEYEKLIKSYNGKIMKKASKNIDVFVIKDKTTKYDNITKLKGPGSMMITSDHLGKMLFIIKVLKRGQ